MKVRVPHLILYSITLFGLVFCCPHLLLAQNYLSFERFATPSSLSVDTPSAIALDREDNLYVASAAHNHILIYDSSGSHQKTLAGLSTPISVAVNAEGFIFVGNTKRDKRNVEAYDSELNFKFKLGTGDNEFTQPTAIAISAPGKIYVVDYKQNTVKVFSRDGAADFSFGQPGSGDGQFNSPTSIAIQNDLVYITDLPIITEQDGTFHEGARVQVFTLDGSFASSYSPYGQGSGMLTKPMGIAVDISNITYVADSYLNIVQAYDRNGVFMAAAYDLEQPMRTTIDVAVAPISQRLYVAALNSDSVDIYCPVRPDKKTYNVDASVSGIGGLILADGTTVNANENFIFTVDEQQTITFSINAEHANGYYIDRLIVDSIDLLNSAPTIILTNNSQQKPIMAEYTFTELNANHTIEAVYALNTYTIDASTTSATENCGQITPTGLVTVSHGSSQGFTISYNAAECRYTDLLVDGSSVGQQASYTFSSVTSDHNLGAIFEGLSYQITASASHSIYGTIFPSGEITVTEGSDQTFSCSSDYGYQIDRIVIDDSILIQNTENLSEVIYTFINTTANHIIICELSPVVYTITASTSADSQGCSISPSGSVNVALGDEITFLVTSEEDYCVDDLLVDTVSVGSSLSHTFYDVDSDHSVTASCSPCFSPVAEAGPNQNTSCRAEVTLVGQNSYNTDADDTLAYIWEQISGTSVTLSDDTLANPTFTAPTCDSWEDTKSLKFQLTVMNNFGATGRDDCIVNVSQQNITPYADAGFDQSAAEGETIILDGTGSVDTDGAVISYLWQQTAGKAVDLSSDSVSAPEFDTPFLDDFDSEPLIFKLTVTDDNGALAEDECIANVSSFNEPPVANISCLAKAVKAESVVALDGAESTADSDIASYSWKQTETDGTVPVVFSSATTAATSFIAPKVYISRAALRFELTVTDYNGSMATETCTVTVKKRKTKR